MKYKKYGRRLLLGAGLCAVLAFGWLQLAGQLLADVPIPGAQPTQSITSGSQQNSPSGVATAIPSGSQPPHATAVPAPPLITKKSHLAVMTNGRKYPLRTYRALTLPNDPKASQPWVTAAAVDKAWDIPRGSTSTLLAVIDTGFALQHEEFQNRWYHNPGEQGSAGSEALSLLNCTDQQLTLDASCNLIDDDGDGIVDNETGAVTDENPSRLNCTAQGKPLTKDCNNIDDDGNGYVDDVTGWDYAHFDNLPQAGESTPTSSDGHHGTYVASVAAATNNNGKGIAGVDGGTTILPVQALGDDGNGDTVSVANAIYYAASQHADVISLSLGGSDSDPLVQQAVDYAIAGGSVVVAAAGNDGCDCMLYPANYPEVLSVGATDGSNNRASFSSYGANLDVMAPGVNLYTADWSRQNPTSLYANYISGTSLATPIVSGLLTRLKSLQPSDTPQQLEAALLENTNRLGLTSAQPRSDQFGYGLLNAGAAATRLVTPDIPTISYQFSPVSKGDYLQPSSPLEQIGSARVAACQGATLGATPVYELSRGGSGFFTISPIEQAQAIAEGYASQLFAYSCLSQPQDTPGSIRAFNVFKEFSSLPDK